MRHSCAVLILSLPFYIACPRQGKLFFRRTARQPKNFRVRGLLQEAFKAGNADAWCGVEHVAWNISTYVDSLADGGVAQRMAKSTPPVSLTSVTGALIVFF
jgi:hypothetical protein